MMRPTLYIFAKRPLMGAGKTRLAAGVGKIQAVRIYRAMTQQILRQTTDPRWRQVLCTARDSELDQPYPVWRGARWRMSQGPGTLTDRLARITSMAGLHIIIGSDAPHVTRRDIIGAVKALKTNRTVFGPALDGGFWLIGVRGPLPKAIYEGVRWSSETTLEDLTKNLDEPPARLRTLEDIDDAAAWRRYKSSRRA